MCVCVQTMTCLGELIDELSDLCVRASLYKICVRLYVYMYVCACVCVCVCVCVRICVYM